MNKYRNIIFITFILLFVSKNCIALAPKLLWEKKFNEKLDFVELAEDTGDVMIVHGYEKDRISIWNKDGNTIWQWGPVLGKCIGWIQISSDGKTWAFHSQNTLEKEINKGTKDSILHVWKKENKIMEISNFQDFSIFWLSRDGKFFFQTPYVGYGGPVRLRDYKGNILWEDNELNLEAAMIFNSPDGNYILANLGYIFIFDLKERKIISHLKKINADVSSLSEYSTYIGVKNKGIMDRQCNIVLTGDSTISGNGKIVAQQILGKLKILRFPENENIGEYSIKRKDWEIYPSIKLSYDGKICVVHGEGKTISPEAKLFVIATDAKTISPIHDFDEDIIDFFITKEGRFLLIKAEYAIYYYKLF